MSFFHPAFRFFEHGPLVDGELELVPAQPRWVDDLLFSCRHPLTAQFMPREAALAPHDIDSFLAEAPLGRFPGDVASGRVPSYQFWMLIRHGQGGPAEVPPLRIAGGLSLRIAYTPAIDQYYGHMGYHVYPAARGQKYAYRACFLALPIFRAHGMRTLWLTCDPANLASRKTIERMGGQYVQMVSVPPDDPLYARGETQKLRYRLDL